MATVFRSLSIVAIIKMSLCIGLVKAQYLNDTHTEIATQSSKQDLSSEGIFVIFLGKVLDILSTTFPERKLSRYCIIVSRELNKMKYRHTRTLAKHFRKLSKMDREDIKEEMIKYRQELSEPLAHGAEFLRGMNNIFTLRENLLLSDYVYDLNDYSTEDKLLIGEETAKVLNDVIFGAIIKLSARDQRHLLKSLRNAIREYKKERFYE